MKRLLILDNYDSFTYNLADYALQCSSGYEIHVIRNDALSVQEAIMYDAFMLSPGPGLPADAGIMPELIKRLSGQKPILGVCLGLQAIGEAYGAQLKNLSQVLHGVSRTTIIVDHDDPIYAGIPDSFNAGRYHSWTVNRKSLPIELILTGIDHDGEVMSIRHREFPIYGVQYHPESILTKWGKKIIHNYLAIAFKS